MAATTSNNKIRGAKWSSTQGSPTRIGATMQTAATNTAAVGGA